MGAHRAANDDSPTVEEDPFLAALVAAEVDDEPYTEEDREAMRRGREEAARGEVEDLATVRARLLGSDRRRSKAG